jgi:hypothetical protein
MRDRGRWIPLLAALAACAGLVWLAARFLGEGGGPPTAAGGTAETGRDAAAPASSRPASGFESTPQRPEAPKIAAAPFDAAAHAADANPLRVVVLDDETGEPVADADVAWSVGAARPARQPGFGAVPSSLLTEFDRLPDRTRTDDAGVAVVPAKAGLGVAAKSGEKFGLRENVPADAREIRLRIRKTPTIALRVVDASGAPVAGVPVAVGISQRSSDARSTVGWSARVVSRSPDGGVLLTTTRVERPGTPAFDFAGELLSVSAHAEPPFGGDRVKADAEELRRGPLVVVVAAARALDVVVLDDAGAPLSEAADVLVGLPDDGAAPDGDAPRPLPYGLSASTRNGVARFAAVPTGRPLRVGVVAPSFDADAFEVPAVYVDDAPARVEVRLTARRAAISARAVDAGGRPLARRRLRIDVVGPHGAPDGVAGREATTDAEGRFAFGLDRRRIGTKKDERFAFSCFDAGTATPLYASVAAPRPAAGAPADLGDVVFAEDVFAEGVVVDEDGAPVADAEVTARLTSAAWGGEITIGPNVDGQGLWPDGTGAVRTDDAGRFRIGRPPQARADRARRASFALTVRAGDAADPPQFEVEPGARGLRLSVPSTSRLKGRCLLPPRFPLGRLQLVLRSASGDPSPRPYERTFGDAVDSGGAFDLVGVPAGVYDLRFDLVRPGDRPLEIGFVGGVDLPKRGERRLPPVAFAAPYGPR